MTLTAARVLSTGLIPLSVTPYCCSILAETPTSLVHVIDSSLLLGVAVPLIQLIEFSMSLSMHLARASDPSQTEPVVTDFSFLVLEIGK